MPQREAPRQSETGKGSGGASGRYIAPNRIAEVTKDRGEQASREEAMRDATRRIRDAERRQGR